MYRSTSLCRSAAALTCLIRVSLLDDGGSFNNFPSFYLAVSREEQIFSVESRATFSDNTRIDKNYILLLTSLAKANIIFLSSQRLSNELSLHVRQSLVEILEARRYVLRSQDRTSKLIIHRLVPNDLVLCVADACIIYAYSLSPFFGGWKVSVHEEETVYFLTVFLVQSLLELKHQSNMLMPRFQIFVNMILSAVIIWIDRASWKYIEAVGTEPCPGTGLWESRFNYLSLFHTCVLTVNLRLNSELISDLCRFPEQALLFPTIFREYPLIYPSYLPRRLRATILEQSGHHQMVKASIERSARRTVRLLSSSSELEWEVWDSYRRRGYTAYQYEYTCAISDDSDLGLDIRHIALSTIKGARKAHVQENDIAKEFLEARNVELGNNIDNLEYSDELLDRLFPWISYKEDCYLRHKWAPYFSSNLEWDWDLAGSLKLLYQLDDPASPTHLQHPAADAVSGELVGIEGRMWSVKTGAAQTELPNEVRIEYRTESGEIRYKTFVPKSSELSSVGKNSPDELATGLSENPSQDIVGHSERSQQSCLTSPVDSAAIDSSITEYGSKECVKSSWPDACASARVRTLLRNIRSL